MHATEEDLSRFGHIADEKRRTYAAMMYALDRGIGRIRQHLESAGQWNNTLCVFFSDNGGATNNGSWNGPLRGVKGCLREGGIRVPMIWTWPNQIPAGEVSHAVVSSLDLLPTFMIAAGAEPLPLSPPMSHEDKRNRNRMIEMVGEYDGVNVLPQLQDRSRRVRRRLFWRLQGQAAMLDGDDKVVRLSHRRPQLFRVSTDTSESEDLSTTEPERIDELLALLGEWEFSLPTMPAWGSSPYWNSQSAKHYDDWEPRSEPGLKEAVEFDAVE
jgi:arylsulfatase B